MKKRLPLLLALLMLFTLVAGLQTTVLHAFEEREALSPEEREARMGGTLILREGGDPISWCPSAAADDNAYAMMQNMFNRLTKLDNTKSPIPDAAASWDVSDDAMEITFHLKENMYWWDGEPLDAEDVKYTFDYIKEHETCYFSSSMDIVDEIEVVDPYTVTFHMNEPDVSFVARIGWYGTFIVPQHIYDNGQAWEDNEAATTRPVGSGPFMFEEHVQGEGTTLVKNPNYHDGEPYLDKLIFSIIPDDTTAAIALLTGEIDHIDLVPDDYVDQLENDPEFRLSRDIYPSPWRFIFNLLDDTIGDLAVRQAIAHCVDRNDISEKVTGGIMPPEWSAYPSVVEWAANTEDIFPDVDIEAARQILEDAGYEADADGYYVRGLTLDAFEGQLVDMSKLLIANCKEAGIEIELIVSEFNAWAEKIGPGGDWMIEAQGGFMGPDPAALASRYGTGSGSNYASYENPEFDELCRLAAAEGDQDERARLYREAQTLLIRDLPAINVVGWAGYQATRATVKDMPIDGAGKWGWQEFTYTYYGED